MAGYTKTNNSDRITTLVDNLNTVSQDVGNLTELNTLVDSDLTSAINELHDSIDGISSRLDSLDDFVGVEIPLATDADTVVGAINELHDSMGTVALTTTATDLKSAINEHETDIGNMTLTGYSASDISAALREAITELGDVTALNTTATTAVTAINEHETDIGNMTFTGLSATNISAAIRELRTELGDHTALTTTATANVVAAINEINSELYTSPDGSGSDFTTTATSVEGAINELDSDIGALTDLTTTDKANVVAAVNELDSDIGSLSSLSTTDKENVVAAINEVDGNVDSNYTRLTQAESDIDSNYTRLTQAESDIDSNYTRLTTAESDIITLDDRVDSIDGVLFANPGDSLNTTNQTVILAINEINSELHGITDGDGTDLTTTASTFAGAINELDSDVGNLSDLSTTDQANVISAINEVHDDAFNVLRYAGDSTQLADSIGDNLTLTTAINEVYAFAQQIDDSNNAVNTRVGSLDNLATIDQTSTVNAINELHDSIDGFINHGDASLLSLSVDSSLIVPVGTTAERPDNAAQGDIRYNTSTSSFEGYSGSTWGSLGGVKDVDGDTYIETEIAAGQDSDALNFYTAGNLALTLTNDSAIFYGNISVPNLTVSGTTTYVNTETLEIDDNMIELNSNVTGTPSENAGIEVERGTSENVRLQWNEDLDRWQATDSDGSLGFNRSLNIVREKDLAATNSGTGYGSISWSGSTLTYNKVTDANIRGRFTSGTNTTYQSADGSFDVATATSSVLGVAKFSTDNFSVDTGNVTIKDGGVSNDELANSAITINGTSVSLGSSVTLVTDDIAEDGTPTNLYFTTARVDNHLDGTSPINYSTGTISIDDATTSAKGAASFSSNDFSVSSGEVTIKTGGVSNTQLAGSIANAKLSNSAITINSTSVSLGGSISVGTVTSVGITAGNLIDVSNSPVTSSGSITVNVDLTELPTGTADYTPSQDQIVYIDNGVQRKKAFGTFDIKNSSGTVIAKLLRAD